MRGTRYKTEEKERIKVKEEEHLIVLLGLREEIGMKTYLHGPTDYANTLKLRFRVGDRDLPERWYTTSPWEEEEENIQMRSCGKAVD